MDAYMSYNFKDHDPVIDIVRTCIEIYATTNNLSMSRAIARICRDATYGSGNCVCEGTVWNWLRGVTRYPRFCNVVAVVHATGEEVVVGKHGMGSRKRFRVIKGGKAA